MGTLLMGVLDLSWRAALVVMAVPGVLFALLFYGVFRNTPEEDPLANEPERELIRGDERSAGERRGVISTRRVLANGSIRVLVVKQFMNAGADVVYTLLMGSYFLSLGVADMKDLGWLVSLPLIGGALGGVMGGMLNDRLVLRLGSRWGRSFVGVAGQFLAAAALWAALVQPTPERVAIGLFFVKFFTDWTQPTVWGTCTDIGGRFSATVFSIVNMAGNVGALLMPLVYGPLLDYFSTKQTIRGEVQIVTDFTPMFVLVGALYIGAGICWLLIDCTQRVDQPHQSPAPS
jgi:sugar phosphate permease